MNVTGYLKTIFNLDKIIISERMKILESHFEVQKQFIPTIENIRNLFSLIPVRDSWRITFSTVDDDNISISNIDIVFDDKYKDFYEQLDEEDIVTVNVIVEKTIMENTFSIYCFNSFVEDLLSQKVERVMASFSKLLKQSEYIIFYLFDSNLYFSTTTMAFASGEKKFISRNLSRIKRLHECKEISYFYNFSEYELIPDDFMIEIDCENNPLTKLFSEISTILSLAYISSTSSFEDDFLKGQICGQRNVDFNYQISDIIFNRELYKIYSWIYTDGNSVDKSIIARNIISLHCKYTDLLKTDEKTFLSIQSNYKLYLKDNAVQYIELKNKLAEFICEIISKIGDHATMILGNFKSNLIAIFGFFFSVVLVNITSQQPISNIFTKDITAIIELILFSSLGYLIICIIETKYKFKKTKNSYNSLKENYKSVLSETDINEVFKNDALLESAEKTVNRGIIWYGILWLVFLIIAFAFVENISDQPIIAPFLKKILSQLPVGT
jgi:hypothetical protein